MVAEDKKTLPIEQDAPKKTSELTPPASRDSEETRNLLAKAREELNRAREESARARDEVERAKKDLAVAKQDPSTAHQTIPEEKKEISKENPSLSEPTSEAKVVEEVPSLSEAFPTVEVANSTYQPEQETQQETPKETNLVKDASENSNQNCQEIRRNKEDDEDKPVVTPESQLELEGKSAGGMSEAEPNTDSLRGSTEDQLDNSKDPTEKPIEPLGHKIEEVKNESQTEEGQLVEGSNPVDENEEAELVVEGGKEEGEVVEDEEEEGEIVEGEHEEDEILEGEHEEDEAAEGEGETLEGAGETLEGEREEGDGEESDEEDAPAKPLDDDEDRRNPQYIPKRGGFYEHDDRNREEVEEAAP